MCVCPSGPLLEHGLTLIPAWISDPKPSKVWDEIAYSFPNFNGSIFEVWEWISNLMPHIIMNVSMLGWKLIQVSKSCSSSFVSPFATATHPQLFSHRLLMRLLLNKVYIFNVVFTSFECNHTVLNPCVWIGDILPILQRAAKPASGFGYEWIITAS